MENDFDANANRYRKCFVDQIANRQIELMHLHIGQPLKQFAA